MAAATSASAFWTSSAFSALLFFVAPAPPREAIDDACEFQPESRSVVVEIS